MTSPSTLTPRSLLVAAAIFLVLAVIQTWPLAINPGQLSRNDNADTMLNEWAISWIASCALGFSWTLDCERVLAGGVSR